MSSNRYDVIVAGIGGMGSAVAYHLAERGLNVLGIERFDIPHSWGSSHGSNRIIRLVQSEDPSYVPLAQAAYSDWRKIEQKTDRDILNITGSIHAGPKESDLVSGAKESVEEHEIQHTVLTGSEVNERFRGYNIPSDYQAVYQPDGGFVDCEQGIIAHVDAAHSEGAKIRAREQVNEWRETNNGIKVKTDKDQYEANDIVFTTGAWTGKHFPSIADKLKPTRQVMAWLQPDKPQQFSQRSFPVFSMDGEKFHGYGFPIYNMPGFKFGIEESDPIDPDTMDQQPTTEEEDNLREFAERYFPEGAGPTLRLRTCMITQSSDGHFIIGSHPNYNGVHIAAGFSGHGFKFTSLIGKILADFVVNGTTNYNINLHEIERLFEN